MIPPRTMMQTARRVASALLVAGALATAGRLPADEPVPRFRLFPEEAPAPERAVPARPGAPHAPERRFGLAVAEIALLEAIPWVADRFVKEEAYAHISMETVRRNLAAGFSYDNDKFTTNQLGHTIAGGLAFNAARTNGYSFWESAPFVLVSSWVWEIFAETQGPSFNDLVNTTLGGLTMGEASYRLGQMVVDSRARGGDRVLRELLGGLVNPTQLLTRVATGEAWAVRDRSGRDVEPSRFVATLDGGWKRESGGTREADDQALLTVSMRYGDPFDRSVSRPFDVFDVGLDLAAPSTAHLTRVEIRGLLGGWDLDPGASGARHVAGAFIDFDYAKTERTFFSAQSFPFGLLAMRPVGGRTELRTEALGLVVPLAAVQTDYLAESSGLVGRSYDYGPGAGVSASARLRRDELDLVALGYEAFWIHTSDGIGRNASLQAFRAEGRVPVLAGLNMGGAWSWSRRLTTYDDYDTVRAGTTQWKVFASWLFR